ncbi:MAG: PaaI family thioesterase [Alicyclobacillus sp.]|nr:PaaI family thioesterase [Alicyclobacillus sp.]
MTIPASSGCFVCGPENPFGLKISFRKVGDAAVAEYVCERRHEGWHDIQHGGITAALLDEASGYVPLFLDVVAMTAEINVSYLAPIRVGERLTIIGRPMRRTRRMIEVAAEIVDEHGEVRAKSHAKMVVLPEQKRVAVGL